MADFNRAYIVDGNEILDARVPKKGGNVGENIVTSLSFTFSDEWLGASKTIVFKSPKKALLTPIALVNDAVEIPVEALDSAGKLQFSLQGTFTGSAKVIRTPIKELDVNGTLPYTGGTPIATYTNVVSLCQDATVSAESAATTANQAAALIAGVPAAESLREAAEAERAAEFGNMIGAFGSFMGSSSASFGGLMSSANAALQNQQNTFNAAEAAREAEFNEMVGDLENINTLLAAIVGGV